MHLLIGIKQQNLDVLEAKFWDVSNPKSPSWQQHMTREEIDELVRSKPEDLATVMSWLESGSSEHFTIDKSADSIELNCSVAEAEKLFDTEIHAFVNDNGRVILRHMGPYSMPSSVADVVDLVEGISDFLVPRRSIHSKPVEPNAKPVAVVVPQTLLKMYKVPEPKAMSKVSQGPAEFQGDASFNKDDLKAFFKQTMIPEQNVSVVVGPFDGKEPDMEASLDIQYITGVGQQQVNWYWTSDNWMYTWSNKFFKTKKVPDAVSISWGWAEDGQCSSGLDQKECNVLGIHSSRYVARVNTEFQKIGLRGVSLFVASGDSGANGREDGECNDKVLHSSFPGSSPYVTTVGATMLSEPKFELENPPPACSAQGKGVACASGGVEVAVSREKAMFTSGGGFSTYSPMPAYQKAAVTSYLQEEASNLPPSSFFNRSHRAFPDLAAMGNNFLVYMSGSWSQVGGTSASAPTVAGIIAHLNDLSYQKTGKTLGFMNQLLYQMHEEAPGAYTDVTVGDNKCTESYCSASCKGYVAAKGWDPVTGLGTPVADKMLAYVGKLLDDKTASSSVPIQV